MKPLIFEGFRYYYGIETTEVYVDLELDSSVLEAWCSCYLDETGFAALKQVAVDSGGGYGNPVFKERPYVVGYPGWRQGASSHRLVRQG